MPKGLIAVIPARAGSRRLPHKNFLKLNDCTLLQLAVECGVKTEGIDRIFVDTDSAELQRIGIESGAEAPYLRPKHLAGDHVSMASPLLYLLDHLKTSNGYEPQATVLLQPTSPLRTSRDVETGIKAWKKHPEVPLASICKPIQSPSHLLVQLPSGDWEYALNSKSDTRFAFEDGSVYITPVSYLRSTGTVYKPHEGKTFEISPLHGVDVDESFQFQIAKTLFSIRNGNNIK